MPTTAPPESRRERDRLPHYTMVIALAALLLLDGLYALSSMAGNEPAWMAGLVLTALVFVVMAGPAACLDHGEARRGTQNATAQGPFRSRP